MFIRRTKFKGWTDRNGQQRPNAPLNWPFGTKPPQSFTERLRENLELQKLRKTL